MPNPSSSVDIPNNNNINFSDFLKVSSFCDSYVKQAIRLFLSLKGIGAYVIPTVIIKDCSDIFTPLLSNMLNTSLLKGTFSTLWKQTAVVSVLRKVTII
jgi:hypothetical protein